MFQPIPTLIPYSLIFPALGVSAAITQPDSNSKINPLLPINKVYTRLPIKDDQYGQRNVSYFVNDDGFAIIDGDVIYGTVEQLRSKDISRNAANQARAFSVYSGSLAWPGATVTYKYDSTATETLLQPIVNAAIARWRSTAPFLTFTQVANSAVGTNGVVMIRAPVCGGCNAHIGFANTPRTMNLQQSCPSAPGTCGTNEATHEFGHVLGLYHEHQRPDREASVHYNCANLDPSCPSGVSMPAGKTCCDSGLPTGCCANSANFDINSESLDSTGAYDVGSIMQYRADAFALPGTNTLTPAAAGVTIPSFNPSNPDTPDFDRICKIYRNNCPKAITCTSAGCPSHCAIIKTCNNPHLCNSDFAPPCCDPDDENAQCQAEKALCATMPQCNFLN